jgi:hypothetical protein
VSCVPHFIPFVEEVALLIVEVVIVCPLESARGVAAGVASVVAVVGGNKVKTLVVIGLVRRLALVALSCVVGQKVGIAIESFALHVEVVIIVLHIERVDRDFAAKVFPSAVVHVVAHVAPLKIIVKVGAITDFLREALWVNNFRVVGLTEYTEEV